MKKLLVLTLLLTNSAYALDCRTVGNSAQPTSDREIQLEVRCLPDEQLVSVACNVQDLNADTEGYGFGTPRYLGSKGRCTFNPVPQFFTEIENEDEIIYQDEKYGRVYAQGKCCK